MIRLTDSAYHFLKKKGKTDIVIEYPPARVGCCAYNVPLPEVFASAPKPNKATNYKTVTLDGINIHIARDVLWPKKNNVEIGLESVLGFKHLTLDGWDITELLNS